MNPDIVVSLWDKLVTFHTVVKQCLWLSKRLRWGWACGSLSISWRLCIQVFVDIWYLCEMGLYHGNTGYRMRTWSQIMSPIFLAFNLINLLFYYGNKFFSEKGWDYTFYIDYFYISKLQCGSIFKCQQDDGFFNCLKFCSHTKHVLPQIFCSYLFSWWKHLGWNVEKFFFCYFRQLKNPC